MSASIFPVNQVRCVILTGSTGSGHRSVSTYLAMLAEENGWRVEEFDLLEESFGSFRPGLLYRISTQKAPWTWATFYTLRETRLGSSINKRYVKRRLASRLAELRLTASDVVLIAHSLYGNALQNLISSGARIVVVIPDLEGGPAAWFERGAQSYIVPTYRQAQNVLRRNPGANVLVRAAMMDACVRCTHHCSVWIKYQVATQDPSGHPD